MSNRREKARIEVRRLLTETIGTFTLTMVACSTEVVPVVLGDPPNPLISALAPGLAVLVLISAFGNVSGAHINPAVTLAFACRRAFPWRRVPGYWLAQLLGAVLAGLLLRALAGLRGNLGVSTPHIGEAKALLIEALLTLLLVTVILSVATRETLTGMDAAIAVGFTIALDGLVAGQLTGASMNPARSLGPVLAGGSAQHLWLYLIGPMLGALAAVALVYAVHGRYSEAEVEKAEGDSTKDEQKAADQSS
jgi:aquaporin Z